MSEVSLPTSHCDERFVRAKPTVIDTSQRWTQNMRTVFDSFYPVYMYFLIISIREMIGRTLQEDGSVLRCVHWLETPGSGTRFQRPTADANADTPSRPPQVRAAGRQVTAMRARRLFKEPRALAKRERNKTPHSC